MRNRSSQQTTTTSSSSSGAHDHATIDRIADNAYTKLVARIAIIAFSFFGPIVAYWGGSAIYTSLQAIQVEQKKNGTEIVLIKQELQLSLKSAADARTALRESIVEVKGDIKERARDRYTKTDAVKDLSNITERINGHREQISEHKRRIEGLEKEAYGKRSIK